MTGYNDPKSTRPVNRSGSGRTLWIVAAVLLALLLLAWLFGLFSSDEVVEADDPAAVTTEGESTTVVTEPAEPVEDAEVVEEEAAEPEAEVTVEEPAGEPEVTVEPAGEPEVIVEEAPAEGAAPDAAAAPEGDAGGTTATPPAPELTTEPAAPEPAN